MDSNNDKQLHFEAVNDKNREAVILIGFAMYGYFPNPVPGQL